MNDEQEQALTLEVLGAVEDKQALSQRLLARRLGVALGLINSYIKRCINKGLIKVKQAPANRYLYYLTPEGFTEKTRLTARFLAHSFSFYRDAGDSCLRCFGSIHKAGFTKIILAGASDLAEIAIAKSLGTYIEVIAVYDPDLTKRSYLGLSVYNNISDLLTPETTPIVLTDLAHTEKMFKEVNHLDLSGVPVFVPDLLMRYLSPGDRDD